MPITTNTRRSLKSARHYSSTSAVAMLASLATTFAVGFNPAAQAAPQDGTVVGGSGSISSAGNLTQINQGSQRLIIDWRSFNIDESQLVKFVQPNGTAIALNRVLDSLPSEIRGQIQANGQVWIVNHHGVTIHASSQIDVGGILVTTADIANADFMAGNYKFTVPGAAGAKVINQGNITFGEAGLAGLVAPGVENSGTIVGKMGSVVVAGQDTFAVDLAGDGLMAFEVSPAAGATSVSNTGSIKNDGGYILITAGQASALVDGVVNVSGSVDASSSTANGGTIEVYGNTVNIASNASLRADGATGGGKVLLGGDLLKAGTSAGFLANSLNVGNDVTVSASATVNGDGGLVETSGHTLTLGPGLSISAFAIGADRQGGTWVIDPDDVEINTASTVATADFVDSVPLVAFLQGGGNALVDTNPGPFSGGPTTDGVDNGEPGDIFVNGGLGAINGAGVGSLTLVADNSIVINSAINTDGALTLQAVGSGVTIGANVTVGGTFTIESGGTVGGAGFAVTTAGLLDINAPGQTVLLSGNNDFQGQVDVTGAAITLSDVNGIILGDIDATGSLTVTAGGAVTQTANAGAGTVLDVGTTTSITATGFDVTLSDALNDFVGQC